MSENIIRSKRKPELTSTGRVKRTGAIYYEVNYIKGGYWTYKEFNNRKEATEFVKTLEVTA